MKPFTAKEIKKYTRLDKVFFNRKGEKRQVDSNIARWGVARLEPRYEEWILYSKGEIK